VLRRRLNVLLPFDTRRGWAVRAVFGRAPRWRGKEERWQRYATTHPAISFVQIGSNDGITGDPLASYLDQYPEWRGIFVEPIPSFFDALAQTRGGDPRFKLVRAAITEHDQPTIQMTAVQPSDELPAWALGLSTLHPEVLFEHADAAPGLTDHLVTVTVPAMTFSELVNDLDHINLVHIDTEGHDGEVLDQMDLARWHPDIIMFEHKHLKHAERRRCRERLRRQGYGIAWDETDTIAYAT
jgi:FkbM family methyltransferase